MSLHGCLKCRNKRKSGPYSKKFRSLQMPGFQFVLWNNLRFPMMCQTMVSRRLTDTWTSIKQACSPTLLSERGYSMIESSETIYGPRISLEEMETGGSTRSSGTSLLPAMTAIVAQHLAPVRTVASRTGWARARIRSIGEGAPGESLPIEVRPRTAAAKLTREAALRRRAAGAGQPSRRSWRRTPPYWRWCALRSKLSSMLGDTHRAMCTMPSSSGY
jgi:hypothetical protein